MYQFNLVMNRGEKPFRISQILFVGLEPNAFTIPNAFSSEISLDRPRADGADTRPLDATHSLYLGIDM